MAMQNHNTYKNVPIGIIKRFVLNKVESLNEVQLSRVYELISGNTCTKKTKEKCVNILVHNQHDWN